VDSVTRVDSVPKRNIDAQILHYAMLQSSTLQQAAIKLIACLFVASAVYSKCVFIGLQSISDRNVNN